MQVGTDHCGEYGTPYAYDALAKAKGEG